MDRFDEITVALADGYAAYGRYWGVQGVRGAVLYHHGIQSHCGWYEASADRLARAGYAVLQLERRGCGRNQTDRGHAESADQLIDDALSARDELTARSGVPHHHVVGVSWGGKLAVAAAVADSTSVRSLTLVTPGLFPLVGVSKGVMAKIGFAMLYEKRQLFDIPLDDPELFTADPCRQQFVAADPLTLRQCTAGFYLASRRMDRTVAKLAKLERGSFPIHLLLAGEEHIIDNEKTAAFIRELHWPRCRITRYGTSRHGLEFEHDRERYLDDLVEFIEGV